MPRMSDRLAENLQQVTGEIAAACARAGRSPSEVTLVAVTKYAEPAWVRRLIDLGVRELGESRPQQLVERAEQLPPDVRWHLIGHLQRNKVKPVLPHAALIHSVDSLRLLERISEIAAEQSRRPRVLLEVNVSGEAAKDGLPAAELLSQWDALQAVPDVEIAGLMTMAPLTDDPEDARPVFRALRQLRDDLAARAAPHVQLTELSMGMSGDFAVAIEEGATLVRIGSRLFEGLES
jgi:pyridoxal phosphate enzyme (YggS family)